MENPAGVPECVARFDYFMVRLSRSAGSGDRVSGLVERLGSGVKQRFDSGEQLVQLVSSWSRTGDDGSGLR
jgi:hypothetical protein